MSVSALVLSFSSFEMLAACAISLTVLIQVCQFYWVFQRTCNFGGREGKMEMPGEEAISIFLFQGLMGRVGGGGREKPQEERGMLGQILWIYLFSFYPQAPGEWSWRSWGRQLLPSALLSFSWKGPWIKWSLGVHGRCYPETSHALFRRNREGYWGPQLSWGDTLLPLIRNSSFASHLHNIGIAFALQDARSGGSFFGKASSGQSDLLQGPKCSFLVVKITWLGQDPVDQLSCLALAVSSPKCVRLGSGRASIRSMGPDSTVGPPIY